MITARMASLAEHHMTRLTPLRTLAQKLRQCSSGVAMIEFAFTAPILLTMGLVGSETAHFAITHMRISQVAMQVADNASRVGELDMLVARQVFERDINEVLVGAEKYGEGFNLYQRGRVIVSSLQRNADGGRPSVGSGAAVPRCTIRALGSKASEQRGPPSRAWVRQERKSRHPLGQR